MLKFLKNIHLAPDSGGQGGYPVATTQYYSNAYTGATEAFDANNTMDPQIKEWYNTEAMENARNNHIYAQFAKNIPLPEHHGLSVEVRKPNTFGDVSRLKEGVIPEGKKFGYSAKNYTVYEYGDYTPIGRRLERHAIDPVAQDAATELGAAGGNTQDKIARNIALSGSNVMYCENTDSGTQPTSRAQLTKDCILTPKMVNKAVTWLKKHKAQKIDGKYICILHPSVSYDIRQDKEWISANEYAGSTNIFNGEIGELHGVRFVESDNAKVYKGSALVTAGQLKVSSAVTNATVIPVTGGTIAANALKDRYVLIGGIKCVVVSNTTSALTIADPITVAKDALVHPGEGGADGIAVYGCVFIGKDAYAMIDVAGGNMETIIKDAAQAGGPLNQFGTVGVYFETGGGVYYEEALLRVECGSEYSDVDEDEDTPVTA